MPVFAVYIQKVTSYFGELRVLGNTYHYRTNFLEAFRDELVAQQCATAEKNVTTSDYLFQRWQTWGPTDGDKFENVMREDGELSGSGALSPPTGQYAELCSLVVWPLPRSPVTNRKRWLRKFLRGGLGVSSPGTGALRGATELPTAALDALRTYANDVRDQGDFDNPVPLTTEDGTGTIEPGFARRYYYTRQIGQ